MICTILGKLTILETTFQNFKFVTVSKESHSMW